MNPSDLLPFREYAWSRAHNRWGQDAWDAVRDDVARNGFRDPAFLEYNHKTGQGYLGEGNHRLGVALELGIPLPVVIRRSTKEAPTFPMKQITEPGQYSMRDERGFSRFREFMRPSDIGLPVVAPAREQSLDVDPEHGRAGSRPAECSDQSSNPAESPSAPCERVAGSPASPRDELCRGPDREAGHSDIGGFEL